MAVAGSVGACAAPGKPRAIPAGAPVGVAGAMTFGWYSGGGGIAAGGTALGAPEGAATGMAV